MAMTWIWAIMAILSFVFGLVTGNIGEVSAAPSKERCVNPFDIDSWGTMFLDSYGGMVCGFSSALAKTMRPLSILFQLREVVDA